MNRRKFLKTVSSNAAGLIATGMLPAWAEGPPADNLQQAAPNEFIFSRFKYVTLTTVKDNWDVGPIADENLLALLREVTNVKVSPLTWEQRVVHVDDFETLYRRPFLFMTGGGEFRFSDAEATVLGEHFRRGGFLYADDCLEQKKDFFFQAMLRELPKALPDCHWEPVPPDHEIYRCFYQIPGGHSPHCNGIFHPDQGMFVNGRLAAFLTSGDVHCGWTGRWYSQELTEQSLRMGVNIIMYSLTH